MTASNRSWYFRQMAGCSFSSCSALVSVTLPASITEINNYAFSTHSDDLVIYVTEGSAAEQFCREKELTFQYATAAPAPAKRSIFD